VKSTKVTASLEVFHCGVTGALATPSIVGSIPVAKRSKAKVCGRSLAEIAGSNPSEGGGGH
jgi:hypothetical protein